MLSLSAYIVLKKDVADSLLVAMLKGNYGGSPG